MPRVKRRDFLRIAGKGAVAGFVLSACGGGSSSAPATAASGKGGASGGQQPFNIPALLDPVADPVTGERVFSLQLQPGQLNVSGQVASNTWGINGPYLGPTLRMRQGDRVALQVSNGIGRNTTMHWHGMHVPSDMDGGPHQLIASQAVWTARFTVNQRASTCWYHPHVNGNTAEQVYHGLAGMIMVEDAESLALGLPSTYGVDDIPVVIQDRQLDANGVFSYLPLSRQEQMRGKLGNTPLINGVANAVADLPAKEVRFRLLNGSNARVYRINFTGGVQMRMIAGDQSLLGAPLLLNELVLSPGERAEVVLDLTRLQGGQLACQDLTTGWTLFTIRVSQPAQTVTTLPNILSTTLNLPVALPGTPVRPFVLGMQRGVFTINGVSMNANIINEVVPVNTLEIWDVQNFMGLEHNFHVHGTAFTVLSRNGGAPAVSEQAWKDTVYLPPNARVRLLVKFATVTVPNAPLMYHCHILEHEDNGMMGQFQVV